MRYYHCPVCGGVFEEGDVEVSTRVSRPGSWGCGFAGCDACFEDRPAPARFCPVDGATLDLIPDDEIDPSIFDYVS